MDFVDEEDIITVNDGNPTSLVCFVYDPQHNSNTEPKPKFDAFLASSAEEAIGRVWNFYRMKKVAILGYGMLQAGLTVQTVIKATRPVKSPESPAPKPAYNLRTRRPKAEIPGYGNADNMESYSRIYCPQYGALATAENAALDAQLQIAGRAFVELKNTVAPTDWGIELLGVAGMPDRLQRYSAMEERLADINTSEKSQDEKLTLYRALKESFNSELMVKNTSGTLGVVGVRRGDFASILGLTAEAAERRAAIAMGARDNAAKNGTGKTADDYNKI